MQPSLEMPEVQEEQVEREHKVPLPSEPEELVEYFNQIIRLSGVVLVQVTPNGLAYTRVATEKEQAQKVEFLGDVDPDFLLEHIKLLQTEFNVEAHPYLLMEVATRRITDAGYKVCGLCAPRGILSDLFCIETEDQDPNHLLGMRVLYHNGTYPDKLVVLGGRTARLATAEIGVIVDIGVIE